MSGASTATFFRRVHHVGIVVPDVAEACTMYCETFGYRPEGPVVLDPLQRVKIQFLLDPTGGGRVELLEPAGPGSPVAQALKKGGGLNHLCYVVDDIEGTLAALEREGAVVVAPPVPACAIRFARVAFLFTEALGVFEIVESPATVSATLDEVTR
jgi:methylmalonyl-CoA/ethylmalonyl-CoA epimerase